MINIPINYNYIACFLTLNCNLKCSYCINNLTGTVLQKNISGNEWIGILNKINQPHNLPISLQGGEPSTHPDFFFILKNIKKNIKLDLLTNIQFSIDKFIENVSPSLFDRKLPYPAIRVSYHPTQMELKSTLEKVLKLRNTGYNIGLFYLEEIIDNDDFQLLEKYRKECNLIIKTKPLLGKFDNKIHGEYFYKDAVFQNKVKNCLCKTSELLIAPDANVYRCHYDLYNCKNSIGNATYEQFKVEDIYRPCDSYGKCSPCDIKLKNNRFQEFGHCSVEIKNVESND